MNNFIKFFFSPVNTVGVLNSIPNNKKILIIALIIVLSVSVNTVVTPLGILPFGFNIVGFTITLLLAGILNLIIAGFIYIIGKGGKNKIQGNFLDNFFFITLSGFVMIGGTIATFLMLKGEIITWAWLGTIIFLGWALVLLSKSLSKLNSISEGRVTFIFIGAVVFLYVLNTYILTPMTGLSFL